MTDIYSQQRKNRNTTILLIAGFIVFVALVGVAADVYMHGRLTSARSMRFPYMTVFALGFASINSFVSYYFGDSIVLASMGARMLNPADPLHKKLHNIVIEMSLASGLPMPRIYVVPDPSPNAFATGINEKKASVAVTQGLLESLNRDELQGVIAHEMGHIKSRDILTMTLITVLIGTVALLSDWAIRSWRFGGGIMERGRKNMHPALLLLVGIFLMISPLISQIIAMAVSRNREYQADTSAAEFTRNPLALASALEKISSSAVQLASARRATAHLFISDPLHRRLDSKEGVVADLFSTHPPIEKRIATLKKMAYKYTANPDARGAIKNPTA